MLRHAVSRPTTRCATSHNTRCHVPQHAVSRPTTRGATSHNTRCHVPQHAVSRPTTRGVTSHNTRCHGPQHAVPRPTTKYSSWSLQRKTRILYRLSVHPNGRQTACRNCIMRSFRVCTPYCRRSNQINGNVTA
jgi:hypothetical protein